MSPPRIDESKWVTVGYVTFELVRELAPPAHSERAFEERQLGDWGNKPAYRQAPDRHGYRSVSHCDAAVNYHASMSAPPENHRLSPVEMLVAARTSIALSAALLLLATYLLALELLGGSGWASLVSLCLYLVPNFQWHATHARSWTPLVDHLALAPVRREPLLPAERDARERRLRDRPPRDRSLLPLDARRRAQARTLAVDARDPLD